MVPDPPRVREEGNIFRIRFLSVRCTILAAFLMPGVTTGQAIAGITEIHPFPASFTEADFSPTVFAVGAGSFYYLDQNSRRLAVERTDVSVTFAGGIGREKDAMFDPVDMVYFDLGLYVCDQSDNRVLRFDWRLNYVDQYLTQSSNLEPLYPNLISVDPWGQLFIYSENFHALYIREGQKFSLLLDLNREPFSQSCLGAFDINAEGDMALFYPCLDELHLYNRFGRLLQREKTLLTDPELLINTEIGWVLLSGTGKGQVFTARGNPIFSLKELNGPILDAVSDGEGFIILTPEQVVSFVLEMDW